MNVMVVAALGAIAGTASAQSSVTLYGTLDVTGKYVKNDDSKRRLSLSQDGINSSQLGFRGVEDLGGGLKAGFNLLSTVNPDQGTANAKFWNRRSTVSLFSSWGELRLGRDYIPTFWTNPIFDAHGANGVGNSFNVWQLQTTFPGSPAFGNFVRADNAIGYFLPSNLGGIYGQAMVAAGEGGTNLGRYLGARFGYAQGPVDVAVAAGQQRFGIAVNPAVTGITAGSHQNTYDLGASYDFRFIKLFGYVEHERRNQVKETRGSFSFAIPIGLSEIHAGYARSKVSNDIANNTNTDYQVSATYQYNLSKRTAMFASAARLSNGDHPFNGVTQSVAGWNAVFAGPTQTAAPVAGGKSVGFELGVRHFF